MEPRNREDLIKFRNSSGPPIARREYSSAYARLLIQKISSLGIQIGSIDSRPRTNKYGGLASCEVKVRANAPKSTVWTLQIAHHIPTVMGIVGRGCSL